MHTGSKSIVYISDDRGKSIKINHKSATVKKFVRASIEYVSKEDVDYILKRVSKYPDTFIKLNKLNKLKSRSKPFLNK